MGSVPEAKQSPIERHFPIHKLNEIAAMESTGFGRRHYRPIYAMHKWWARRLGCVFRAITLYALFNPATTKVRNDGESPEQLTSTGAADDLWSYYVKDVDLGGRIVLDPMMGGGTTIVEALRLGCRVIGGDLNPVSWFIVKKEIDPVDPANLQAAFNRIDAKLGRQIRSRYATNCPECRRPATAMYYFWVKQVTCMTCGNPIPLFDTYRLARSRATQAWHILCPQCGALFNAEDPEQQTRCPRCDHVFAPSRAGSTHGRRYQCPSCGDQGHIVETIRQSGKPSLRNYAVSYYCRSCDEDGNANLYHGQGLKAPDGFDAQVFDAAVKEFKRLASRLPLPLQHIPRGQETHPRLMNHGYLTFSDMFNERQLLNLGQLLQVIAEAEDANVREFMLLAFSNTLKYNNMFCKYNSAHHFITDIFRTHSYSPSLRPVESNCYDLPRGMGAFKSFVNLLIEGKQYCKRPFDRYVEAGKPRQVTFSTPIEGHQTEVFADLGALANALLLCGSSESLPVPDKSVDAVLTDPPYYGNVQYAELSDFFYVWLRLLLKDTYRVFEPDYTPKDAEIVRNLRREQDPNTFVRGLTRVFCECRRTLKDQGLMVFTFHHRQATAWAAVLQSILDAGFYVTAAYPVNSEMHTSTHILRQAGIEHDAVLVCRKKPQPEDESSKSWDTLLDVVSSETSEVISTLQKAGASLSKDEVSVVALGKGLEVYSRHFPNVVRNGRSVDVHDAVESIGELIATRVFPSARR
jgi:putative DNA methylase